MSDGGTEIVLSETEPTLECVASPMTGSPPNPRRAVFKIDVDDGVELLAQVHLTGKERGGVDVVLKIQGHEYDLTGMIHSLGQACEWAEQSFRDRRHHNVRVPGMEPSSRG